MHRYISSGIQTDNILRGENMSSDINVEDKPQQFDPGFYGGGSSGFRRGHSSEKAPKLNDEDKSGDWFYVGRFGGLYPVANVPNRALAPYTAYMSRLVWIQDPAASLIKKICAHGYFNGFPEKED
jgi:hypothetical protein